MSTRINRAPLIDQRFIDYVEALVCQVPQPQVDRAGLPDQDLLELFDSQMISRQLDLMARIKRQENKVFYTIGSSGHEGNALLGRLTRQTDPAFLHYRSGAFMAERYRKLPHLDFIDDTCLSFAASCQDPASGGRHKVWGHPELWVLPQTSTIASHLPKALGVALAIESGRASGRALPVPKDAVVICSFGDASLNHATAQTTLNALAWTRHQNLKAPLIFVCEDNGWGISVPTPSDWVRRSIESRYGIRYLRIDGLDLVATHAKLAESIDEVRSRREALFVHLDTVRLMGHAGTDFEIEYRDEAELVRSEDKDPLRTSAWHVVNRGLMRPEAILARYKALGERILERADWADQQPKLSSVDAVVAPLAPLSPKEVEAEASRVAAQDERATGWASGLPEASGSKHMAILINQCLTDLLIKYPQAVVFGEDVAKKGGVYTVTKGLWGKFGRRRIFNTLLDETTILGMAQGYASMGFLPMPEIQYLAYFHNACDQIRGEACSLQFFSNGRFKNPMVMRIAGLGYQKGFGGHFHNDNSITALRDIPGLVIGVPSRGDDAVMMLRTMMAMAAVDGRVCAFIEPIALYMTKDLYAPDDRQWCFDYPTPEQHLQPFEPRCYGEGPCDLLIVTYGNAVPMALRVQQRLLARGRRVNVLDLRWIKPLPLETVAVMAAQAQAVLAVDEGRPGGSVAETVLAHLAEHQATLKMKLLTSQDTYIPLAQAAERVLVSEADIDQAAQALLG